MTEEQLLQEKAEFEGMISRLESDIITTDLQIQTIETQLIEKANYLEILQSKKDRYTTLIETIQDEIDNL